MSFILSICAKRKKIKEVEVEEEKEDDEEENSRQMRPTKNLMLTMFIV